MTNEEKIRNKNIQNIYAGKKIRIEWNTGFLEYDYSALLIRPKGVRQRDHDRFVRKIIDLASKNGGWQIVNDSTNTM